MATTASPSAISQVLRTYAASRGAAPPGPIPDGRGGELRLRVANDRASREAGYRLAHRVYSALGCANLGASGVLVAAIDARPETMTFLAETGDGDPAATVTLVVDGEAGLQADDLHRGELDVLRRAGLRLGEVSRLAIDPRFTHSRVLLARLIDLCYVYSLRTRGLSDVVIEVHPRHVPYYQRLVGFAPMSEARICPRVGKPGLLMRVELAHMAEMTRRWSGHPSPPTAASLYAQFCPIDAEPALSAALAADHQPMGADEREHFGLGAAPGRRAIA